MKEKKAAKKKKKPVEIPLSYPIPPCENGTRYVVSDIHGCSKTFDRLLEKIQLHPTDQLFLLGDYIDKGPNSKKVLDRILGLLAEGYQVFSLRGNHEDNLLKVMRDDKKLLHAYLHTHKSSNLLNKKGEIRKRFRKFLRTLPYYFELADVFLVHAGFNFKRANIFQDRYSMLNIRHYKVDAKRTLAKPIIHGHNPLPYSHIRKAFQEQSLKLPLDNGCVFAGHKEGRGKLLCYNLDQKVLIEVENIEKV